MGRSKSFKCGFDINDYTDILPDIDEYLRNDEILNYEEYSRGDYENCYWKKHRPTLADINSHHFRRQESTRILKTGVWICIKDQIIWLPPNTYWALEYCPAGSSDMQFRLKRLKHCYFKVAARNNPGCIGLLTLKNRGDGQTTFSIGDAFWECLDGNMDTGQIGIQSYSRDAAKNPCWNYVQTLWQTLPKWIKTDLCSDFVSGTNIAEKMQWMREADEKAGLKARNVVFAFYPSGTPMDGKHDLKVCLLDECAKYEECSFYDVFTNYSKFIMPGFERRGMFDMFSSPADHDCRSNNEVYQLWKDSDTNEMTDNGTTKSRIHRYYSNPLDGIAGAYDKFGDADPNLILAHIMREREKMPKDKLFGEIRGFPLNESEMFESTDDGSIWSNVEGITKRKLYLMGARFKDDISKEPLVVYGNLDWTDGIKDYLPTFRQSDKGEFDVHDARFCFSFLPKTEIPLDNIFNPPNYVENAIGIDSVDKRYAGKRPSNLAMVNTKFLDLEGTGIVKCPTMIYCNRPLPIEIAYEDAIKAAVFLRAKVQLQTLNSAIVNYFEDRGYINWMLSKIGLPKNSLIKGDAPSGGKSAFMDEIVAMLDAVTNVPVKDGDQYLLELNYFFELLDDLTKFNLKDTHARDLSMAWGQSLLACSKLLFHKARQPSSINNDILHTLLG